MYPHIPQIPPYTWYTSYTTKYDNIPSYTITYPQIPSYTSTCFHIPPYASKNTILGIWEPTWDPQMVISQAQGCFQKWEFDTMRLSMFPRAPHIQKGSKIIEIMSFEESRASPGESSPTVHFWKALLIRIPIAPKRSVWAQTPVALVCRCRTQRN